MDWVYIEYINLCNKIYIEVKFNIFLIVYNNGGTQKDCNEV